MHNEMSGNGTTVLLARDIHGSVTALHQCPSRLVFLQALDLLGSSASFKQVAALDILRKLAAENPELVEPVLQAVEQWLCPPEMVQKFGVDETMRIRFNSISWQNTKIVLHLMSRRFVNLRNIWTWVCPDSESSFEDVRPACFGLTS